MFCVNHAKRSASPSAPRSRHAFRIERQQETNYGLAKMISPTHSFYLLLQKETQGPVPVHRDPALLPLSTNVQSAPEVGCEFDEQRTQRRASY
jgi:hypothetical protein